MRVTLMKEFREFLPITIGAVMVIWLTWLALGRPAGLVLFAVPVVCALLAAGVFGAEFQHNTMAFLLAQPRPRSSVWADKMLVLIGGLGVVLVVLIGSALLFGTGELSPSDGGIPLLIAVCALCSAPLLTLWMRSGIAGAVASLSLPLSIALLVSVLAKGHLTLTQIFAVATVLFVAYCVSSYWAGYRLFLRLEILDGEPFSLPLPWLSRRVGTRATRTKRTHVSGPGLALLCKEMKVLQPVLLLGMGFSLMYVLALAAWRLGYQPAEFLLAASVFVYVILVPFLTGALATCEERAWGVAQWQLTLPARASTQWLLKAITASVITVLLGLFTPVGALALVEYLSAKPVELLGSFQILTALALVQLLVSNLAMLSGTRSSTTIKAVLLAGALAAAAAVSVAWSIKIARVVSELFFQGNVRFGVRLDQFDVGPREWNVICLGLLASVLLCNLLAYRNYRRAGVTDLAFVAQVLCMLMLFGMITATIYHHFIWAYARTRAPWLLN